MPWIESAWVSAICWVLWQGDEVLEEQTLNNNVDAINQERDNLHFACFYCSISHLRGAQNI